MRTIEEIDRDLLNMRARWFEFESSKDPFARGVMQSARLSTNKLLDERLQVMILRPSEATDTTFALTKRPSP